MNNVTVKLDSVLFMFVLNNKERKYHVMIDTEVKCYMIIDDTGQEPREVHRAQIDKHNWQVITADWAKQLLLNYLKTA